MLFRSKTSEKSSQSNTATKPKTVKQKDKTVADNSGKSKEKDTQNLEKQSANISSANTSTSTPVKTTVSTVDKTSHQVVVADKVAANKAEINALKNPNPFSLEQEILKIKISVPLTELATQHVYRTKF